MVIRLEAQRCCHTTLKSAPTEKLQYISDFSEMYIPMTYSVN